MSPERLFHQRHPVLTGLFFMAALTVMFFGGITFFVSSMLQQKNNFLLGVSNSIGVIEIKGVITDAEETLADILAFSREKGIKAVVVRIDSPGGAVGASQELFMGIKRLSQEKPVVASMGSVAASGGFYAAIGAEKIVAAPGTLTGSMGVIIKFANLEQIFNKIGYQSQVVKSGQFKDMGSPDRALTEAELTLLQNLIDSVHGQFVADIAESRSLNIEDVKKIADGRIFSGEQAREYGLIDELGNFNDAVRLAASLANMDEELPKLVYPPEEGNSILGMLLGKNPQRLWGHLSLAKPILSYEWDGTASLVTH
ncbi:MAG: signal peptide peptidase SppA [Proteobacteria bacterium]|nr:signal peptide peptidase SppA [Pseudomonadota bacterium]MBU1639777.1 signal peptide peptidase SppA [Pseudomonadota bacterium]